MKSTILKRTKWKSRMKDDYISVLHSNNISPLTNEVNESVQNSLEVDRQGWCTNPRGMYYAGCGHSLMPVTWRNSLSLVKSLKLNHGLAPAAVWRDMKFIKLGIMWRPATTRIPSHTWLQLDLATRERRKQFKLYQQHWFRKISYLRTQRLFGTF